MNPKLRQRVLRDWMGAIFPITEAPSPANLPAVFQRASKRLGLADRLQESTLVESWPDLVGVILAAHCRPRSVRRGVLGVMVDHPAWLHQITLSHKNDILHAVQERFPHLKIKDLSLRIG